MVKAVWFMAIINFNRQADFYSASVSSMIVFEALRVRSFQERAGVPAASA
jgi:hypothetical protein